MPKLVAFSVCRRMEPDPMLIATATFREKKVQRKETHNLFSKCLVVKLYHILWKPILVFYLSFIPVSQFISIITAL